MTEIQRDSAEKGTPRYLRDEWQAVVDAQHAYLDALDALQARCEHPTVLKFTSSDYLTSRVCEDCGYHESVQWDSTYKYKDQRLTKRAYSVSWAEYYAAREKVHNSDLLAPRAARSAS